MDDTEYFKTTFGLRNEDVLLVPYGSRVYGTYSDKSDHDFLVIVPENSKIDTGTELKKNNNSFHVFNSRDFAKQLEIHKIHALEGYFHPDGLLKQHFQFKLDKIALRHELSEKANHSFVKAKKKIEVEKDFYIGWKSLFHSLRILCFGIQIANEGTIYDFSAANHYWVEIRDAQQYNWDFFKEKYQPEYNKLASYFRKLAPKE